MCHFLILSYATFGHCCTWAKSLRSLRSSQHPYSRKITGQFSWVNRYFWHRAVPSVGAGISSLFCLPTHPQPWALPRREVETRKGDVTGLEIQHIRQAGSVFVVSGARSSRPDTLNISPRGGFRMAGTAEGLLSRWERKKAQCKSLQTQEWKPFL